MTIDKKYENVTEISYIFRAKYTQRKQLRAIYEQHFCVICVILYSSFCFDEFLCVFSLIIAASALLSLAADRRQPDNRPRYCTAARWRTAEKETICGQKRQNIHCSFSPVII